MSETPIPPNDDNSLIARRPEGMEARTIHSSRFLSETPNGRAIRKKIALACVATVLLGVIYFSWGQYTQLRGINTVIGARIFLAATTIGIIGLLLIGTTFLPQKSRLLVGISTSLFVIWGAYSVESWAVRRGVGSNACRPIFSADLTDSHVEDVVVSVPAGCFETAVQLKGAGDFVKGVVIQPSQLPSPPDPQKSYAGNPYLKPGDIGLSTLRSPSSTFDLQAGDKVRYQATYWNSSDAEIPDATVYAKVAVGRADIGHFEDEFLKSFKTSADEAYRTDRLATVNTSGGLSAAYTSPDSVTQDAIDSLKAGDHRWQICLASEAVWKTPDRKRICRWISHNYIFKVPIDASTLNPVVSEVTCEKNRPSS
jgi:hypothetical protein